VGRAQSGKHTCNFLRARRTGFYSGVGVSFVYFPPALRFGRLCVARRHGCCDHKTIEALVGSGSPHPPAKLLLMYTRATTRPNLYIRNIMPGDMGIPLLGYRALLGWGYADVHAVVNVAKIHRGFCLDASRRARDMLGLVDAVLYEGRIGGLGSDLVIWRSGIKRALYFLLYRSLTVSSCNIS
jgi:hypothetical protein